MAKGTIAERRKKVVDHIVKFCNSLDPSGSNADKYIKKFKDMTDNEFDKYMREFFRNEKANLYIEFTEYEKEITIENIEKTANMMGVPLLERVALPYLTGDPNNVIVTPYPVPVGYSHQKRMPQTLVKKSTGSTSIEQRSSLTGQVTSDDKNARNSDLETYSLATLNAVDALREFMGPRADNMYAKNQMYNDITKNGYVSLAELELNDPYSKVALNTFDTYFLMMGIKTNLVTTLDKIPGPR